MTADEWEAVRRRYPGCKRYITTEQGQVFEWPWKSPQIPKFTRLWTVEKSGLPWQRLDNDDYNFVIGREWHEDQERKKKKKRGNKKAQTEPRRL